jgi:hypothetical protein
LSVCPRSQTATPSQDGAHSVAGEERDYPSEPLVDTEERLTDFVKDVGEDAASRQPRQHAEHHGCTGPLDQMQNCEDGAEERSKMTGEPEMRQ